MPLAHPPIKPSGIDKSTQGKGPEAGDEKGGRSSRRRGSQLDRLKIDAIIVVKADPPAGSRNKGFEETSRGRGRASHFPALGLQRSRSAKLTYFFLDAEPPRLLRGRRLSGKTVVAKFDGGLLSSDGGILVLREVEQRLRVADRLAACIQRPAFA